jgi:hypothetical protein
MSKLNSVASRAALERELRCLRRHAKRLELSIREANEGVKVYKTPRKLATLEDRMAAHLEAAKEFDYRLMMAEEIFGADSPSSP